MATDGVLLWRELFEVAAKVCAHYGLTYGKIEPDIAKKWRYYGECESCDRCYSAKNVANQNCKDKIIKIRIHQLHRRSRPLSRRVIFDTLAHELAHLRPECWDHGRTHTAFTKEILAFVREIGYSW